MPVTVLDCARNRIRFIFSQFKRIVVSYSGGKDSTCLLSLALEEARRTDRQVEVFFLDQEAEYQATIDMVEEVMSDAHVIPRWYQVPIKMTNATSHRDIFLHAWEPGKEWIRKKSEIAIHGVEKKCPDRFYKFFDWFEQQDHIGTAHLVGLRIFESMSRQRTMLKANGYQHYKWSTACKSNGSYRFYPIYDFHFADVWKYIADNNLSYNRTYDRMYASEGVNIRTMRVSNLIHEQAFRSLANLQEFEPETFDKLAKRLSGVHCAGMYSLEDMIYSVNQLPKDFATWKDYRDHILATTPIATRDRFIKRFSSQDDDHRVHKHQVKQLLLNDWEGKLPMTGKKGKDLRNVWWGRL